MSWSDPGQSNSIWALGAPSLMVRGRLDPLEPSPDLMRYCTKFGCSAATSPPVES